jgi:hypothetical protein
MEASMMQIVRGHSSEHAVRFVLNVDSFVADGTLVRCMPDFKKVSMMRRVTAKHAPTQLSSSSTIVRASKKIRGLFEKLDRA